ncbi:MAG: hypothetical protein FWG90_05075 [Oscillospiraceae bacterium]|nr:hypothetical protein [Oscillospiraceae bacterium]
MNPIKKILNLTLCLFLFSALCCFVAFHLGFRVFLIEGDLNIPAWLEFSLTAVLFYINLFLIGSFIIDEYNFRTALKLMLPYFGFDLACSILIENAYSYAFLFTGVLPFVYMLVLSFKRKNFKSAVKRLCRAYMIIAIFQVITEIYKLNIFKVGFDFSFFQLLILTIDLVVFLIVIYCTGGVKYALGKYHILSENIQTPKLDSEDLAEIEACKQLRGFKRIKAISLLLSFQLIQWAIVLLVCSIGDVLIEGLAITVSFVVFGTVIKRKWHSQSVLVCTISSVVIFYTAARFAPSYRYTQLLPVVIALLISYASYRVVVIQDEFERIKKENDDFKNGGGGVYDWKHIRSILRGKPIDVVEKDLKSALLPEEFEAIFYKDILKKTFDEVFELTHYSISSIKLYRTNGYEKLSNSSLVVDCKTE